MGFSLRFSFQTNARCLAQLKEKYKIGQLKTTDQTVIACGRPRYFSRLSNFRSSCLAPEQKLLWLKITTAIALICGFALSFRLWISSRLFPLSPVSDSLPAVPFPFDYIWFFVLIGLLLAIIVIAQPRRLILAFLALAALLSLWDQTRWQPWFYQYCFMLAAIGLYAWKKPDARNDPKQQSAVRNHEAALNACRVIVVFTYFWSGLQKLNSNFVRETWPDIAGPWLHFLPPAVKKVPAGFALIIPLLEVAIALGLITRKFRNVSIALAVATHIFVLMLLLSSGENAVVWPWNIAMALSVVILFWQDKQTGSRNILAVNNAFHALVLLFFAVLPAFSFVDRWDSYLSSALYSGNTDQAVIYVSPSVIDHLPAAIRPHIWQSSQPFFLDINRWAYGELNVPVYPEPRIYRRVAEQICTLAGNSSDIRLRILKKPNPFSGLRKSEYYDCDHLDAIP